MLNKEDLNKKLLEFCILNKKFNKIKQLIEDGADINVRDDLNNTPLHYMVFNKSIDNIEYLVDNGADVNAINKFGFTPLDYMDFSNVFCQDEDEVEAIRTDDLDNSNSDDKIQESIECCKSLNILSYLVEKGAKNGNVFRTIGGRK